MYSSRSRADLEAAQARLVDALHFLAAVDDIAAGGEFWHGHVLEQVAVGVLQEVHGGGADLVEVEAADVGCHGHAETCLDDALHLLAAVDDLAAGGEIGHGHVLEQVALVVLQ